MESETYSVYSTAFDKLNIDSKLSDLPLHDCRIPFDMPGREIELLFKTNSSQPGVILVKAQEVVGLLSRDKFFEVLASKFGRAIFSRRPVVKITEIFNCDYTSLASDCPIRDAAQIAFSRGDSSVQSPIVVKLPDNTVRLLSAFDLLEAQCRLTIISDRMIFEHQQQIREQKIMEEQISLRNQELEVRIAARTKELEDIQKNLIEASRQAGMAEVATDVLHNVGNILNSVNISTNLIAEQVDSFELDNIQQIVELLKENQSGLGSFFQDDEKGKYILPYLDEISHDLSKSRHELSEKIGSLKMYVEHLKEITKAQQSYARLSNFQMEVDPAEIIRDAVKINSAALTRHKVELILELEETGILLLDKQKILQIMVNLINNAKYATTENGKAEKWIKVRLYKSQVDTICFEVQDNGVGISQDNMTKIFQHGFTTKKDGHGFGLHGGILAAREMNGSLTVFSDGLGKGAIFKLELPLNTLEKVSD